LINKKTSLFVGGKNLTLENAIGRKKLHDNSFFSLITGKKRRVRGRVITANGYTRIFARQKKEGTG
jgi:hypothetical protein